MVDDGAAEKARDEVSYGRAILIKIKTSHQLDLEDLREGTGR